MLPLLAKPTATALNQQGDSTDCGKQEHNAPVGPARGRSAAPSRVDDTVDASLDSLQPPTECITSEQILSRPAANASCIDMVGCFGTKLNAKHRHKSCADQLQCTCLMGIAL